MIASYSSLVALLGATFFSILIDSANAQPTPISNADLPLYVMDEVCVAKQIAKCVGESIPEDINLSPPPKQVNVGSQVYYSINTHFFVPVFKNPIISGTHPNCIAGNTWSGDTCVEDRRGPAHFCPRGYEGTTFPKLSCKRVADHWSSAFGDVHQSCNTAVRAKDIELCKRALPSYNEISELIKFIRSDYFVSLRKVIDELKKSP